MYIQLGLGLLIYYFTHNLIGGVQIDTYIHTYIQIGNMYPIPQYSEGIHFGQVYGCSSISLRRQTLEQHCKDYST